MASRAAQAKVGWERGFLSFVCLKGFFHALKRLAVKTLPRNRFFKARSFLPASEMGPSVFVPREGVRPRLPARLASASNPIRGVRPEGRCSQGSTPDSRRLGAVCVWAQAQVQVGLAHRHS